MYWNCCTGMYENVKYIQCLMKEVNIISRGNLQGNVTVQGTDEDCTVSQWTGTYETNIGEKRADRV